MGLAAGLAFVSAGIALFTLGRKKTEQSPS
jgi:hypothetical protein